MPDVAKMIQIITHMCKMIFNTFLIVWSEKKNNPVFLGCYFMVQVLRLRLNNQGSGVVVSTIASQ